MSFRLKTIIGIAAIEAVVLCILIWSSLVYLKESNQQELIQRAATTSKLFATMSKDAVLATDLASLDSFMLEIMKNPGIVYARVVSLADGVLAQGGSNKALARPFVPDTSLSSVADGVFDVRSPIEEARIEYGYVDVGLDIHQMRTVLQKARSQALFLAVIEMALTAMVSFLLGAYLTRQLRHLEEATRRIAKGQLGYQIPVKGRDELAQAATMFNRMSAELELAHAQWIRSVENLTESEAKMRAVLQGAVDGIITIDTNGCVESFNPAAERIFGFSAGEIIGRSVTLIMPEPTNRRHQEFIERYLKTGKAHIIGIGREVTGRHKNGRLIQLDLGISEVLIDQRKLFTAFVRDITKAKAAEAELKRYQEELEKMVAERTRKLEKTQAELITRAMASARAQMSAMVLHNVGNAVTPAGVYVERLKSDEGAQLVNYLGRCHRELADHAGHLDDYIANDARGRQVFAALGEMISALDRLERHRNDNLEKIRQSLVYVSDTLSLQQMYIAGDGEFKELTDLNHLIEDALRMQMSVLEKRGIMVSPKLARDLPLFRIAKNRLMQVLLNIIKNSYEAIDAKGDTGQDKKIEITSYAMQDRFGFKLSDSGIGLDEQQLAAIFQLGRSGKGSSGIGLYYSKMFIEANEGQINLASDGIGEGATVTVEFKMQPS